MDRILVDEKYIRDDEKGIITYVNKEFNHLSRKMGY